MNEKDRWSVHVEYLKLAIALSTALIAAGAAIYVDPMKIPPDWSRYIFLAAAGAIFLTLIFSLLSTAALSNHFIHSPIAPPATATTAGAAAPAIATPPATPTSARAKRAVKYANWSFFALAASVACLAGFFATRTLLLGGPSFERAVNSGATASAKLVNSAKGESTSLTSVELRGDSYVLVFRVIPTSETITVHMDVQGGIIKSAQR